MDTTKAITHIGLCAGYGGIELGLARVLPTLRSVALCEIEAFPIANLVAKMEAGLMDAAPVWTDLKTFPWESFRDRVDILTGGYPCQPFSAAGKRAGKDDPRHLWPWIADGIRILRPRMCFFENVEGHISLGLSSVISDLEELGYQVSWGIFSAREVGAPHQRKRVFILAHRSSEGFQRYWGLEQVRLSKGWEVEKGCTSTSCGFGSKGLLWSSRMANTNHEHGHGEERGRNPEAQGVPSEHWQEEHSRWESWRADAEGNQVWPSRPGESQHAWEPPRVVGNAIHNVGVDVCGTQCTQAQQSIASDSGSMGNAEQFLLPTSREHGAMDEASSIPTDREGSESSQADSVAGASRKREGDGSNAAECCETQPTLGGNADGPADWMDYAELYTTCDNRTDELRLLGNGVVPATAERAFRVLMNELMNI